MNAGQRWRFRRGKKPSFFFGGGGGLFSRFFLGVVFCLFVCLFKVVIF